MRGRKFKTEALHELRSSTTTLFRLAQSAMERQAQFTQLWQEAQPDLKRNAIQLERLSIGANILADDLKGTGAECLAAAKVAMALADELVQVSANVTASVMLLMQSEEEPGAVLEDLEASVQHLIGQTLRLAALAGGPEIDASYIRSILVWATEDTLDEVIEGMLPGLVRHLAAKFNRHLGPSNWTPPEATVGNAPSGSKDTEAK